MYKSVEDRVIYLLNVEIGVLDSKYGFWTELGKSSGIETTRWRRVYDRKQRITSDMLEVLAKKYPQFAFWLVTGITGEVFNGEHIKPNHDLLKEKLEVSLNALNAYD